MMEGSESVLIITDPDPDPGGPTTYESYGAGYTTLIYNTIAYPVPFICLTKLVSVNLK
jgi:hypothetical protein